MSNEILKLKEIFNKLKGKTIYFIEEQYNYKTVLEDGGYDHLGPLPQKERQIYIGKTFYVEPVSINEYNLYRLIKNDETYFFDKETAEWVAAARQLEEKRKNQKRNADLYATI